jgi:site-specific recombinase XerD
MILRLLSYVKTLRAHGREVRLALPVHPHMLRHVCGYKLANDGHDTHTIRRTSGTKHPKHGEISQLSTRWFQRVLA